MDTSQQPPSSQGEHAIDQIWLSSKTARQIYVLGEVERDIGRLLSLASSSVALLTLPQTDSQESTLPQGEERSEQFVLEVSEYFERLDQIHISMRSALAHIRQARISPAVLTAPPLGFVPPPTGVTTPSTSTAISEGERHPKENEDTGRGLQEERINRDAWKGILDALQRIKAAREAESASMKVDT